MGLLWLGAGVALSILFYRLTLKVSDTEAKALALTNSLLDQEQTAAKLVSALTVQRNELSLMTRSLKVTQEALIDSLPDDRRREFALKLADAQNEQTVRRQETPVEKSELSAALKALLRDEGKKEGTDSAESHFLTASSLGTEKKYPEALKEFDAAIAADRKYVRAYVSRAWINNELGRYQEAINDCNQAIALEPENPTAYNNRGWARLRLKDFTGGIEDFSAAIARGKTSLYYANRASAYLYKKDYGRAMEDYREAAKMDPAEPSFYIEISRIQWKIGQTDEALRTIQTAIQRDTGSSKAYSMRAFIEVELRKWKDAVEDFNKAQQLDNSNVEAYAGLGFVLNETKKFTEAIQTLNKAIELRTSAVDYSNRGYAYLSLGNYAAAEKDLLQAISISPEFAPAHAHLGYNYAKTGHPDAALRELALSIQLNPSYGKAYRYRAEIYTALGEKAKADADAKEAKRIGDSGVKVLSLPE